MFIKVFPVCVKEKKKTKKKKASNYNTTTVFFFWFFFPQLRTLHLQGCKMRILSCGCAAKLEKFFVKTSIANLLKEGLAEEKS